MGARQGIIIDPNVIGKKFGVLTVVDVTRVNGRTYHMVKCECGIIKRAFIYRLKKHKNEKCVCGILAISAKGGRIGKRHGEVNTRLYQIWENMKQRCLNKNAKRYINYGGRGIVVCNEWLVFEPFRDWALNNGYAESLTIDRKDNDGNYCQDNCRWITNFNQQSNTRKSRKAEYNGIVLHVSEWARRFNTSKSNILYHLNKNRDIGDIIKIMGIKPDLTKVYELL